MWTCKIEGKQDFILSIKQKLSSICFLGLVSDKLNIFVHHMTLRARPLLRPCAFCLSGVAGDFLIQSSLRFSAFVN